METASDSRLPSPVFAAIHFILVGVGAATAGDDRDISERVQIAREFIMSKIGATDMGAITAGLGNGTMGPWMAARKLEELLGSEHLLALGRLVNGKFGFPDDETCDRLGGWGSRIPVLGQGVAGKGWRRFIKRL